MPLVAAGKLLLLDGMYGIKDEDKRSDFQWQCGVNWRDVHVKISNSGTMALSFEVCGICIAQGLSCTSEGA